MEATSQNSMGALRYAIQILAVRGLGVERVAGLVQDGLHVPLQADGIHENERHPRLGKRGLITARRLAFAIVEVEQFQVLHLLETRREIRRPAD